VFNRLLFLTVYLFALIGCEALLFDQSAPVISTFSPADGAAGVHPTNAISITFDESMDRESVERAFSLSRETEEKVSGTFSWSRNTLLFTPAEPLDVNPKYIIRISRKAEDKNGNNLLSDHISTFTVSGRRSAPTLINQWPGEGTYIASRTNDILLTFSTNMDLASMYEAFSIAPSVSGMYSLISNGTVFRFHPTSPLVHGSVYTVRVSRDAKDTANNALGSEITFTFTAGTDFTAPSLVSFSTQGGRDLRNGDDMITNISKTSSLLLSFSEELSSAKARSAFSIEPSVDGVLRTSGSNLTFTPRIAFSCETVYTVKIADSATDLQGNTIARSEKIIFKTDAMDSRYLYVEGIYNETNFAWRQNSVVPVLSSTLTNLKIKLSAPVSHIGVIPNFSFDYFAGNHPSLGGAIGDIQIISNDRVLLFDLKDIGERNIYEITITRDAYDLNNNPMRDDWIFFFQT